MFVYDNDTVGGANETGLHDALHGGASRRLRWRCCACCQRSCAFCARARPDSLNC